MGCSESKGRRSRGTGGALSIIKQNNPGVGLKVQEFKLCVIGDFAVGKSCIVNRYCHGSFSTTHLTTIGAAFSTSGTGEQTR
jgi:GTPase SAR1 family protein